MCNNGVLRVRRRCARQRSKTRCWRSSRIRSSMVYGGRRSSSVSWRLSAMRGVVRPHAIQRPLKKGDIRSAIGSLTCSLVVYCKNYTKHPEIPKKCARRVRSFCVRISTGEGQRGRRLSGKAEQGYGVRCERRMHKNSGVNFTRARYIGSSFCFSFPKKIDRLSCCCLKIRKEQCQRFAEKCS